MLYFKKTRDKIIKYELKVDTEKLKELKDTIIEKSSIKKIKKTSPLPMVCAPRRENIRFLISTFAFTREDFYGDVDYYIFEYIEYTYPEIIKYIDMLLNGNTSAVNYLLSPPKESKRNEIESLEQKIKDYSKNVFDKDYLENMKKLLDELESEKKVVEMNKLNIPVENYFEEIKNTIELKEIERIDISVVEQVNTFYESDKKLKKVQNG